MIVRYKLAKGKLFSSNTSRLCPSFTLTANPKMASFFTFIIPNIVCEIPFI